MVVPVRHSGLVVVPVRHNIISFQIRCMKHINAHMEGIHRRVLGCFTVAFAAAPAAAPAAAAAASKSDDRSGNPKL